jgi:alanine racemase
MAPTVPDRVAAPTVRVDLDAIRENARTVCSRVDGRVVGVTKAVAGDPAVARAMLDGGVDGIGDSRVLNLERVGEGMTTERTLLVPPMPSSLDRAVAAADRSLYSEVTIAEGLAAAARARGVTHEVILMVDTGDRREGVLPADAPSHGRPRWRSRRRRRHERRLFRRRPPDAGGNGAVRLRRRGRGGGPGPFVSGRLGR